MTDKETHSELRLITAIVLGLKEIECHPSTKVSAVLCALTEIGKEVREAAPPGYVKDVSDKLRQVADLWEFGVPTTNSFRIYKHEAN